MLPTVLILLIACLLVRSGVAIQHGEKQEGYGPIDSRVMVMISDSKLGLLFEVRRLNYPVIHVHITIALSHMLSKSK